MEYEIRKISNIKNIGNLGNIGSAIISDNGFREDDLLKDFPDLFNDINEFSYISNNLTILKNTEKFTNFIAENKNKKFCIIGDYDTDGICATSIMKLTFDKLGIECSYIIPNRLEDGYGINISHVDKAIAKGAEILITVDNGICCNEALNYAYEKGLTVIVTDHHMNNEVLPKNEILIDPHTNKDSFEDICGGFISFKLSYALLKKFEEINKHQIAYQSSFIMDLSVFAMASTIADVMPLIGENREIAKIGLNYGNYLRDKNAWGSIALKFLSGFSSYGFKKGSDDVFTEQFISFSLAPMINSQGRVYGNAEKIVDDIISVNKPNGGFINGYRDVNFKRKNNTGILMNDVKLNNSLPANFYLLDESKYNFDISGIIGIVSSNLLEKNRKPTLVGTYKNNMYVFSGRSNQNYSLLNECKKILTDHPEINGVVGGHNCALGLHLNTENDVKEFGKYFQEDNKNDLKSSILKPIIAYEFDKLFYDEMFSSGRKFAPYGHSFSKLIYHYSGIITNYNSLEKTFNIGDIIFRTFKEVPENKNCDVYFTTEFDKISGYFLAKEVKEIL